MIVNWYDTDGNVGLTKTQKVKNFNSVEAFTEKHKRRVRVIDYLIASSVGTPIEAVMAGLLSRYKDSIDKYVYSGGSFFADAINNESEEPYLTQLALIVGGPTEAYPAGITTSVAILNQITE